MNKLDVYYRALLEYRQTTSAEHECSALSSSIAESDIERDSIVIKRAFCTIDEDWVEAIEKGLVHIEKAIKEERQFIRSNGEVVPIENVKNVSKESIEHLAKHSNLITKYQEGQDIIPEKLYTVERLSDYAVYENRFLYMLLCYLRDFVTLRYEEILELTNKYDATVSFDKQISNGRQKLNYKLSMHDVRNDDDYLKEHNPAKDVIDRIDLILKAVLAFLSTPLIEDVAKAPMIKPPITKTNVLKMNNNFKGAVALYDYIVAYDKPGYTIETDVKTISPFRDDLAHEMAESGGIVSFLAYEYGLGIKQELKESYAREEERRKVEKIKQRQERIAAMKRRLEAGDISIEEYVITLEKQLRALEGESDRAEKLADEIEKFKAIVSELNDKVTNLSDEVSGLKTTLEDERHKHFLEINELKAKHEDEMHQLIVKHEEEVERMLNSHREQMEALRAEAAETERKYIEKIDEMNAEFAKEIERINSESTAAIEEAKAALATKSSEYDQMLESKNSEYAALLEEKRRAEARIKALGGVDREYTDRESFNELEKEYQAFTRFYKEEWSKTKKLIRKKHLNAENIKGKTENTNDSE